MGHEVLAGKTRIGSIDPVTHKMTFDNEVLNQKITEITAGKQAGTDISGLFSSIKVVYQWDRNRMKNNDALFSMWKENPIMQNRVKQLNALLFGRGFKYSYDKAIEPAIDRFWRINRIKRRLNSIGTDAQLFGEIFLALTPQKTGDVLLTIYESNLVEIDFNPMSVDDINFYAVAYKDEEKGTEEILKFQPLEKQLNELEMQSAIVARAVKTVKKAFGQGNTGLKGHAGVMIHLKFNNSSAEVRGTSDFRQTYGAINDYIDFVSDRLDIHSVYGSPMFDVTIESDGPNGDTTIQKRIEELASFQLGMNPIHSEKETWKMLEWSGSTPDSKDDASMLRGLACAGTGFPEHLLFNQGEGSSDGTFALNKIAEDYQDTFGEAFQDIHKYVALIAGGDFATIDEGRIIFPEVSTMSEKQKAETYVLKVGSNICSRKTAAYNLGHDWDDELEQMLVEQPLFMDKNDGGAEGQIAGRFNTNKTPLDPKNPEKDDPTKVKDPESKTVLEGSNRKQATE